ncbi:aminotransferase class I/II-fold pyridoxal phosphate-dependent enzyme [Pseudarthrobacter sp. J1738]|uniref:aminotransferase class I/II-fold pyridoxal phosphate-dependent enzyme n=1 Tax=Pseudarthrobacter sp. J1738 TaxID=3420446 RepID=UPI003D2D049C
MMDEGSGAMQPWQRTAMGANLLSFDGGSPTGSLGVTIFEEMTSLATATGAINLGQGFPDEDGPEVIKDAARLAISNGANQYAPGKGFINLRSAISRHQQRFYGLIPDPETEIIVTTGATEAIAASILALVSPGDEVITFEPFYDSYGAMIALAGGKHVTVQLKAPEFQPDLDELTEAFSDRTKVVLLNNPHNPTGAVFGANILERLVQLAHQYDAVIISDEVYEHLVFGAETVVPAHVPIATVPGAAERTLTISSAGKTFSLTGWKVGWLMGPADLVAAVRTVKQFMSYSSGPPFQNAIAQALELPDSYYTSVAATLKGKRDLLITGLKAAGLAPYTPAGTYFVNADVTPLGVTDATALARALPELIGVAAIPVGVFCTPEGAKNYQSLLRFAFCKREEVITQAVDRLAGLGSAISTSGLLGSLK